MNRMNVDPIVTFGDGSQLLVSTQHVGEGRFTCELYLSTSGQSGSDGGKDGGGLQSVTGGLEAPTCRQAQEIACSQARSLYPSDAPTIKEPPYLIWPGPHLPMPPDSRWRRSWQGRRVH